MRPESTATVAVLEEERVRRLNGTPRSPYIRAADVAARLHVSLRTVHELSRRFEIPHRKLCGGSSPCLYLVAELVEWENGAELEVIHKPNGGRIVRPKGPA